MKAYTYDGPALPSGLTSDPRVKDLTRKVERNRQTFEEPKGEEPKSLFELGGRAVDASRKGLRNAGSAIGIGGSETEVARPPLRHRRPRKRPRPRQRKPRTRAASRARAMTACSLCSAIAAETSEGARLIAQRPLP
ncbi:hypothetical protein AUC71_14605 [Methyloceanibacter marginalis]|uniref:Uncharacterized protein n=1 Tax=Methyloceanibacter marginalis TaxID=1774971 RepID=A0A1E3W9X3_9HYPH|nr:hypothetical protein AUC71_14605 [Methyloceanibacter marginalis]